MGRFTTSILAISAVLVIVDLDCCWLSAQEGNEAQIVSPDQSGAAATAAGTASQATETPADSNPPAIAKNSGSEVVSNGDASTGDVSTNDAGKANPDGESTTPNSAKPSFSEAFFRNPLNLVLLVFVALYVLILFLPKQAKKEQKALQARLANLKKNDRVILNSGIHGVVANINSDAGTVTLRVDEGSNAKITVDRNAIRSVEA
ncbi:MAG: preprotein translocase subunit YajC [Pirellula sp.]|jgi:preprotein translocase YajC subunit|nr:preprotein translocase subunit YajC [Pirellula sp.]